MLVNAVKTVWSTDPKNLDEQRAGQREATVAAIVTEPCVSALAKLIGRSKRYPTLINEGVVALSLISTHAGGGTSMGCVHAPPRRALTPILFYLCVAHPAPWCRVPQARWYWTLC